MIRICIFVRKIYKKTTTNIPRVDGLLAGPLGFWNVTAWYLSIQTPGFWGVIDFMFKRIKKRFILINFKMEDVD